MIRFDDSLRSAIAANLDAHERRAQPLDGRRHAAVAVVLVDGVFAVYRIGLQALVDTVPRFVSIPESNRPVLQLPLGDELIHAPTGAVLFQLRQVGLLGRISERVDEIGEPVFAWS